MTHTLKGNHSTEDPRLDRVPEFDPRSREYPIRALGLSTTLRSIAWRCTPRLNQGKEGACVGFGWSHELAALPIEIANVTNSYAAGVYHAAQEVDQWPGHDYSGTSVLAGAKVIRSRGFITGYRWAFTVDEALQAISHAGPVVIAVGWRDTMYHPRLDGLLDCSGRVVGGHCLLARGLRLSSGLTGVKGPVVRLRNSWGVGWGVRGDAFIRVSDFERLLKDDGEACLPLGRKRPGPITTLRQRLCP